MQMKLFGPKWEGSPAAEECEIVDVPAGQLCFSCGDEIYVNQSGAMIWHSDPLDPKYVPWHRICLAFEVLGVELD